MTYIDINKEEVKLIAKDMVQYCKDKNVNIDSVIVTAFLRYMMSIRGFSNVNAYLTYLRRVYNEKT